jgi:YHS domain-containing protein
MAHRANVIPVAQKFSQPSQVQKVVDPVCKQEMDRKTSKHMLFQPDSTYYFCSKDCMNKFTQEYLHGKKTA